jgi:hypothetical protein
MKVERKLVDGFETSKPITPHGNIAKIEFDWGGIEGSYTYPMLMNRFAGLLVHRLFLRATMQVGLV